ncbi:winged helix-turn-helix domain-containing protein, partial [Enterobacter kobei]
IFSVLWEQYGYTPSNSSLNTYVSLIRKAFVNLGQSDELVVTIPKVGFIFSPDIAVDIIEINSHPESEQEQIPDTGQNLQFIAPKNDGPVYEDAVQEIVALPEELKPVMQTRRSRQWIYTGAVSGAIILAGIIAVYFTRQADIPQIVPVNMGHLDGCPVHYLPAHAGDTMTLTEDEAYEIVKSANFPCKNGGAFYFYADKNVTSGHPGKIYVSSCQLSNRKMTSCLDYMNHHFIFSGNSARN